MKDESVQIIIEALPTIGREWGSEASKHASSAICYTMDSLDRMATKVTISAGLCLGIYLAYKYFSSRKSK